MKVGDKVRHIKRDGTYIVYKTVIVTTLDPWGEAQFNVTYYAKHEYRDELAFTFNSFDIRKKVFPIPKEPNPAQLSMWDTIKDKKKRRFENGHQN